MAMRVRRAVAVAAVLSCALLTPAQAQQLDPPLRDEPQGGFAETTTPTPSATATATASPTPTVSPRRNGELANTGADPRRLALAGLSLLCFGLCFRFRLALADERRRPA